MSRNGLLCAVAVLVVAAWVVPASGYWFDIWGVSADGSMPLDPSGGYSNGGAGNGPLAKDYHFMTYMAFNQASDGPDKRPPGASGDTGDGVGLADWLVGKKAFAATVYFRNATDQTCDPAAADGACLNDPVTVLGFRCANAGPFSDHETYIGHAGTYSNPCVGYADMAPVAWRMGQLPYTSKGSIGAGGEYWKVSTLDSKWPGAEVKVGQAWFGTTGYGGFSANPSGLSGSGVFAFSWLVQKSDAIMVNSGQIGEADCSGEAGGDEPRDLAHDQTFGEGWFAKHIDRSLVNALGGDPEMKGLVFDSVQSPVSPALDTSIFGREQSSGVYGPYLAITATYAGDCNNDGCVDVVDVLTIVPFFQIWAPENAPVFDPECDLNCDGAIDVVDLLYLVDDFGKDCLN